jgi:hypothetical protein
MPFEIFLIPGLLFFVYGFFKSRKYYDDEYTKKDND